MVVALGAQLNGQLGAMSTWLSDLLEMLRTADHYRWLISTTKGRASGDAQGPAGGGLHLANVTFRYPGTTTNVLNDITLTIPAGSTVAVVGENGAGKTTLVKLLIGLYEPTSGVITVDDVDIATVNPASWRQGLSGAFQDTPPLEFRLRDVVGIGDVTRLDDDDAIHAAIDAGNASEVADGLPFGIETELGKSFDNGTQLSGGQWQRLALARAMMRPAAHVLMLDEPTANLDPRAEHEVFERYATTTRRDLGTIHPNITVLISHRFATVEMATFIVVLDGGRIVEQGNHRDLIDHNGVYAELFRLQASAYH
jgi:ATP-binding cassette subfamily B protein